MSGQRILVVDDEPQILRALRTTLRGAGYEVDTAETVEAALAAAAARPPEAVILDLVLPDGSGTDVCREFRTWSEAPVIVLSAVGEEREKVAALDAGADDYVTKPFSVDELLARLRAVLRRSAPASEPVIRIGELSIDVPNRTVLQGRQPREAQPARVRPSPGARSEPREAAHAPDAAARGLGPGVPGRGALHPRVRLQPAPKDRARSIQAALPAHGAGRRVQAGGARLENIEAGRGGLEPTLIGTGLRLESMYDLAGLSVAAGCFAFAFFLIWVLAKI